MNDLSRATITSLEIAEMMETEHYRILRKLEGDKRRKGYVKILTDAQMGVSDYFIPSTYRDTSGKENKCYEVTKLGCDFLANKFTGEKGVIFTAKYVKRFYDMEQALTESTQQTPQLTAEEIVDWKLNDLHKRLKVLEGKEADKPKIHLLTRLTPKKNTWYEKNRNRIWRIRYDRDMELRELYRIILEECGKYYDLDEAEKIYREKRGRVPAYPIDLVEYFPELQDIANQVLDYFEN